MDSKDIGKVVTAAVGGATLLGVGVAALVVDAATPAIGLGIMVLAAIYSTAPFLYQECSLEAFGIKMHTIRAEDVGDALSATIAATPSPPLPLNIPERTAELNANEGPPQLQLADNKGAENDKADDARQQLLSEPEPIAKLAILRVNIEREVQCIARLAGLIREESDGFDLGRFSNARGYTTGKLVRQLESDGIFNRDVSKSLNGVIRLLGQAMHGVKLEHGVASEVTTLGPTMLAHLAALSRSEEGLKSIVAARARMAFSLGQIRNIRLEPHFSVDDVEIDIVVPVATPETEDSCKYVNVLVADIQNSLWLADRSRGRPVPIVVVDGSNSRFIGNSAAKRLTPWLVDIEIN